jgi:hypothetical protein
MMDNTLALACSCGAVRGHADRITARTGNRVICYCDDCQAYAHWLERADELLDRHGGTEVYQLTPAQLTITAGAEHVCCMRMSPKGLMRWHTGCCKTPLGNTMAKAKMPFVGIPHLFFDDAIADDERDRLLGPVRAAIQGRFARGGLPAGAHPKAPPLLLLRILRQTAVAFLRRRYRPSPFFDAGGLPVVEPQVIGKEERQRLRGLVNHR